MIALAREADRSWMADAACRGHDPETWFPRTVASAEALNICVACPVRVVCADYAERLGHPHGVWGGMTLEQRRRRARMRGTERG